MLTERNEAWGHETDTGVPTITHASLEGIPMCQSFKKGQSMDCFLQETTTKGWATSLLCIQWLCWECWPAFVSVTIGIQDDALLLWPWKLRTGSWQDTFYLGSTSSSTEYIHTSSIAMNKCSKVIPAVAQVMILVVPIALSAQELIDIIFIKGSLPKNLKEHGCYCMYWDSSLGRIFPHSCSTFFPPRMMYCLRCVGTLLHVSSWWQCPDHLLFSSWLPKL